MPDDQTQIDQAVELILDHIFIDGDHHKTWLLDQTLRLLLGTEGYEQMRREIDEHGEVCEDDDCTQMHEWEWEGIAP